jgi:hypothetical protein
MNDKQQQPKKLGSLQEDFRAPAKADDLSVVPRAHKVEEEN